MNYLQEREKYSFSFVVDFYDCRSYFRNKAGDMGFQRQSNERSDAS